MSHAPERWKFISGRLCLDFINTVGGRISPPEGSTLAVDFEDFVVRDRLHDYEELVEWSREAGDLSPVEQRDLLRLSRQKPQEAGRAFAHGIRVRECLYRVFKSAVEEWDPPTSDFALLQSEFAKARGHRELAGSGGRFAWRWKTDRPSLERPLWPVLESAESLLTSADLEKLRQCGGEECGWFFLDESRGGRRQWCEMRDCGNLAKVRRHRERQRRAV